MARSQRRQQMPSDKQADVRQLLINQLVTVFLAAADNDTVGYEFLATFPSLSR
jgi:hypothetical protein